MKSNKNEPNAFIYNNDDWLLFHPSIRELSSNEYLESNGFKNNEILHEHDDSKWDVANFFVVYPYLDELFDRSSTMLVDQMTLAVRKVTLLAKAGIAFDGLIEMKFFEFPHHNLFLSLSKPNNRIDQTLIYAHLDFEYRFEKARKECRLVDVSWEIYPPST